MQKISIGKTFLVASLIGSAASLAMSSYFIYQKLSSDATQTVAPISTLIDTGVSKAHSVSISPNLFGAEKKVNAPMLSKLDIRLLGVMPGATMQNSKAMLRFKSKPESFFGVGEEIVKGVSLSEVYSDRIVIDVSGRSEVVYFPDQESKLTRTIVTQNTAPSANLTPRMQVNAEQDVIPQPPSVSRVINKPVASNTAEIDFGTQMPEVSDTLVKAAMKSPESLLRSGGLNLEAGAAKVGENSMVGRFLGLNAGDKVLSVDGMPIASLMSSPQKAMALRGKTVNIAVMRNGQRSALSITVP